MKLNVKAKILIFFVGLLAVVGFFIAINRLTNSSDDPGYAFGDYGGNLTVVVEDELLKLDFMGLYEDDQSSDYYFEVLETIDQGWEFSGYQLEKAEFSKVVKLTGPDQDSSDFIMVEDSATHEAYILALYGDVVAVENEGETTYHISNGYLKLLKQQVILETDYNSLYIKSMDGRKEKMVDFDVYRDTVVDPDRYLSMLNW